MDNRFAFVYIKNLVRSFKISKKTKPPSGYIYISAVAALVICYKKQIIKNCYDNKNLIYLITIHGSLCPNYNIIIVGYRNFVSLVLLLSDQVNNKLSLKQFIFEINNF